MQQNLGHILQAVVQHLPKGNYHARQAFLHKYFHIKYKCAFLHRMFLSTPKRSWACMHKPKGSSVC